MADENAILVKKAENEAGDVEESFDFDELEEKLQGQLENELSDMQALTDEKEKIGSPDELGKVVGNVIWEQFLNQIAVTAGEDFIEANRGLTLDLRNEAHIQTTENFADGKIATHNTEIDYQQRYDDWQSNFQKDENGNVITHKTRAGNEEATLVKGARKPYDENRPSGSKERHTDMDHTVSAGEIIRDPAAAAHMTKEEQVDFANSEANLNEMDSSWNRSKGDMSMSEWLDNPNSKGQKPDEIFEMSEEQKEELRKKDDEAREEFEKRKKEGERKSIEAGKKSQRAEAFRIGKQTLRAVVMQLLTDLMREIITKLVKWFKSAQKALGTLLDSLKEAIHSFVGNMKTRLINAGNTVFTTVATAIIGPVVATIKKAWMMLKQGWKSLKDAVKYIKDPANKGKPIGILMMEVGKILIAGLTGTGAMLLGEVVEKGLMTIPIFAFEIPLLGSLANILGIFVGAVVAGIIGAIAINLIEKQIEKRLKNDNLDARIDKSNKILNLQHQVQKVNEVKLEQTKAVSIQNMYDRHVATAEEMASSVEKINENCAVDQGIQDEFEDIDRLFDELEDV